MFKKLFIVLTLITAIATSFYFVEIKPNEDAIGAFYPNIDHSVLVDANRAMYIDANILHKIDMDAHTEEELNEIFLSEYVAPRL